MRLRRGLLAGLVGAVAASGFGLLAPGLRTTIDLKVYDTMLRSQAGDSQHDGVAVVVIDDRSIAEVGQWPWPRDVLASLVDSLSSQGASVLALDLLLSESDRLGTPTSLSDSVPVVDTDVTLARALERSNVVLGHAFTFHESGVLDPGACSLDALPAVVMVRPGDAGPTALLPHPTGSVCSLSAFQEAVLHTGFLNADPDPDGILRRVPLIMAHGESLYPSLALAATAAAGQLETPSLESTESGSLHFAQGDADIPIDPVGSLLVRFWGGEEAFEVIEAADVLHGRVERGTFDGQIVFVGATALGLRDVVATSFDSSFPGLLVHATVASNLLERSHMRIPSWAGFATALAILVATLGICVATARSGVVLWAITAGILATALWFLATVGVGLGLFVSPLLPYTGLLFAAIATLVLRLRAEGGRADQEQTRRERAQQFTIESLTGLVGARDHETGAHVLRTREYAELLIESLSDVPHYREYLTPSVRRAIVQLAPLHDIGKVAIADSILRKPGRLTDEEYAEMKRHPDLGLDVIIRAEKATGTDGALDPLVMRIAKEIVHSHHERWDGSGYPQGLAGEDIPFPGRILAVVDVYDALVQKRVYRDAMSHEEARDLIVQAKGRSFEPVVVEAFIRREDDFRALSERSRKAETEA